MRKTIGMALLHTQLVTLPQQPLSTYPSSEQNETVRQTTERMLEAMFGLHTGRVNRLDNVEIAMDRGYWEAAIDSFGCWIKAQTFMVQ